MGRPWPQPQSWPSAGVSLHCLCLKLSCPAPPLETFYLRNHLLHFINTKFSLLTKTLVTLDEYLAWWLCCNLLTWTRFYFGTKVISWGSKDWDWNITWYFVFGFYSGKKHIIQLLNILCYQIWYLFSDGGPQKEACLKLLSEQATSCRTSSLLMSLFNLWVHKQCIFLFPVMSLWAAACHQVWWNLYPGHV